MTDRKAHQLTIAGLVLVAFVVGSFVADYVGMAVLALTTLVTLVGGLWRRADVVEWLRERRGVMVGPEPPDSERTGHRARLVEGGLLLVATGLVAAGASHAGWGFDLAGWALALLTAALASLDGLFNVGVLAAAVRRLEKSGLLPAPRDHG